MRKRRKIVYDTKQEANQALASCWLLSEMGDKRRNEKRIYKFDDGYCLTSQDNKNDVHITVTLSKEEVEYLIDVVTVFRKRLSRKKTCFLDMIAFTDDLNAVVNAMKVDRRKKMLTNIRRILRYELKRQKK